MGPNNAVLPKLFLRKGTINCLRYEKNTRQPSNDNLCFFRMLALHSLGAQRLQEEISNLFILLINQTDELSAGQFKGFHMNDVPNVGDLLTLKILLNYLEIVDRKKIGELYRRSLQKYENIE